MNPKRKKLLSMGKGILEKASGIGAREKMIARAQHGRDIWDDDWFVEKVMTAYHAAGAKVSQLPVEIVTELTERIAGAVAIGSPSNLRRLADAVERVRTRANGWGASFRIEPASRARLKTIKAIQGSTLKTKAREVQETSEAYGEKISERTARRIRRNAGAPPLKRGRPKKRK